MEFKEVKKDLFTVPETYYLAHCISADFGMYGGIAVEFNKHFDMKNKLKEMFKENNSMYINTKTNGFIGCVLVERIFNLITKKNVYNKPNYFDLRISLKEMRDLCIENNITKIAMPKIGCGIDLLEWKHVSKIIKDVFKDIDIEILVCKL